MGLKLQCKTVIVFILLNIYISTNKIINGKQLKMEDKLNSKSKSIDDAFNKNLSYTDQDENNDYKPKSKSDTEYLFRKLFGNEGNTEENADKTSMTDATFTEDNNTEAECVGDPVYCNMTKEEYMDMLNEYIFPTPYEWVLIAAHGIVFVVGLIGNALVCSAVYRNHTMRTVTNYFIVNLALADFLVILICLPPTVLWDVTETWFFGTTLCRVTLYFQSVSVTVSVLTLTFISVDRWYAICFPLKFKSTTGRAKKAILIIWLLSLIFNIPEFVVLRAQRKQELRFDVQYFWQCASTWSPENDLKWHIIKALFLYTFPLLLMTVAYCQIVRVLWRSDNIPGHAESHKLCPPPSHECLSVHRRQMQSHANASTEGQIRSRRKAAKMLVAVVVMFAVCYFPVHMLSVLRFMYNVEQTDVMTCIALISHVMIYANSAINPLIYNFMSGKFRREFHRSYFQLFCCCQDLPSPDRNASFAPIGCSRTGTTKTFIRRQDSCTSYRLNRLSPSNHEGKLIRNSNTSFIERGGNRLSVNNDLMKESLSANDLRKD